jgi:hypothetical protein
MRPTKELMVVGSVEAGGNIFSLRLFLSQFSGPVDIYGAFRSSTDPTLLIF